MKTKLILPIILCVNNICNAQNSWSQQQNCPFSPRMLMTSFTINDAAYILSGFDTSFSSVQEMWSYSELNGWNKRDSIPMKNTLGAASFTIGNMGYFMSANSKEMWAYDIDSSKWYRKMDFPVEQLRGKSLFSHGNYGYVAFGDTNGDHGVIRTKDIWRYDPSVDNWFHRTTSTARTFAVSLNIENEIYIGLGLGENNDTLTDWWLYNPTGDTWVKKKDFPDKGGKGSSYFVIDGKGYVTGDSNRLWQYNPDIDEWILASNFPGKPRKFGNAFTLNNKGYFIGGYDNEDLYNDFWEYTPDVRLGVNNAANRPEINIYPNPAHDFLNIDSKGLLSIEILSTLGESLIKTNGSKIDVSGLPPGVYFVKIDNETGACTKRVVIQH